MGWGMRKLLIAVMLVACCGMVQAIHSKGSTKDSSKAKQYYKYAEDYEKKAKKYEKSGNQKMSEIMRKCAEAKKMIADGYKSGDKNKVREGLSEYKKACEEFKNATKDPAKDKKKTEDTDNLKSVLDDKTKSAAKSGSNAEAEHYLKRAEYYSKQAKVYEAQGQTSLAKRFHHFADTMTKKALEAESGK